MSLLLNLLLSACGGALLSLSSTLLMASLGHTTGISGILHTALTGTDRAALTGRLEAGASWRVSYLLGLLSAGLLLRTTAPSLFVSTAAHSPSFALTIAAGAMVAFGSRLGGGCTSGHGVCGLPRLSVRSLTAVLIFFPVAALTAHVIHSPWLSHLQVRNHSPAFAPFQAFLPTLALLLLVLYKFQTASSHSVFTRIMSLISREATPQAHSVARGVNFETFRHHGASFLCALLFGIGLGVAGMTNVDNVLGFLLPFAPGHEWRPQLAAVMAAAVACNAITWRLMSQSQTVPLLTSSAKAAKPLSDLISYGATARNLTVDWRLVTGSIIFGVGWGMLGVCPGPAIVALGAGVASMAAFCPGLLLGASLFEFTLGTAA